MERMGVVLKLLFPRHIQLILFIFWAMFASVHGARPWRSFLLFLLYCCFEKFLLWKLWLFFRLLTRSLGCQFLWLIPSRVYNRWERGKESLLTQQRWPSSMWPNMHAARTMRTGMVVEKAESVSRGSRVCFLHEGALPLIDSALLQSCTQLGFMKVSAKYWKIGVLYCYYWKNSILWSL